MFAKRDVDVRNNVTGSVRTNRRRCVQRAHRIVAPVHARVSDRQTESRSTAEVLRFFVKSDRVIESTHLAIQRRQQRLAINKCRVQL